MGAPDQTNVIVERLRQHGISPTRQRLAIASVLLGRPQHLNAEQAYELVSAAGHRVSRATVYNTLALLVERRLLRQIAVTPTRIFYDSTTRAHHHYFNLDTGELTDIPGTMDAVVQLPALPESTRFDGLDLVVRIRNS